MSNFLIGSLKVNKYVILYSLWNSFDESTFAVILSITGAVVSGGGVGATYYTGGLYAGSLCLGVRYKF